MQEIETHTVNCSEGRDMVVGIVSLSAKMSPMQGMESTK